MKIGLILNNNQEETNLNTGLYVLTKTTYDPYKKYVNQPFIVTNSDPKKYCLLSDPDVNFWVGSVVDLSSFMRYLDKNEKVVLSND
jgi:hypothetical protein